MLALTPSVQSPAAFQSAQNRLPDATAIQPLRAYDLRRYGGVGDGVTANDAAIAAWTAACNAADAEGFLPQGTFLIAGGVSLPRKLHSVGEISGAHVVTYGPYSHGYISGYLECAQFLATGLYFCDVGSIRATTSIDVDGYSDSHGTFWNTFRNWRTALLTVSITNFSVNLNHWIGGRAAVLLTGNNVTYPVSEAHDNTWESFDFTGEASTPAPPYGLIQNDTRMQVNFVRSCYFEAGATIVGNFHILGWHGDAQGTPAVGRFNHLMGATGVNARLFSDFLSVARHNAALGGGWDFLDASDKPLCLAHAGGASVSVQTDTTEPCGIGRRYEATFADAFDNFSIAIAPTGNDRFGLALLYKSTADFAAVSSNDGSGDTSYVAVPVVVDAGNNWKLLRISGPASKTAGATVTLFAYGASGGAAKVMSIGGISAGGERAVLNPQVNREFGGKVDSYHYVQQELVQHGRVTQSYVAASPVDVAITFPVAFDAAPHFTFTIEETSGNTPHFTKAYIKSGTRTAAGCTVRVEYAGDWDGAINWQAMGRRDV